MKRDKALAVLKKLQKDAEITHLEICIDGEDFVYDVSAKDWIEGEQDTDKDDADTAEVEVDDGLWPKSETT